MNKIAIVLAGGSGKRMQSHLPKSLQLVLGKPIVVRIIKEVRKLDLNQIIIICMNQHIMKSAIEKYTNVNDLTFCVQENPIGTAHAVKLCIPFLKSFNDDDEIIVLNGDCPLINGNTIQHMFNFSHAKVMGLITNSPESHGRILTNNGKFIEILEEKDCSPEQCKINLVNCSVLAFKNKHIMKYIDKITNNNNQNEYHLSNLPKVIKINENVHIDMCILTSEKEIEFTNVNDRSTLAFVNDYLSTKESTIDYSRISQNFESPEEYIKNSINIPKLPTWILEIINHKREVDKIIFENERLLIIPDIKNYEGNLHVLVIIKNSLLKSIRDLNSSHIPLLQEIIDTCLPEIERAFCIKKNRFNIYFHYHPSVWQMHVHFKMYPREKSYYSLEDVITNLQQDTDFYKKACLQYSPIL